MQRKRKKGKQLNRSQELQEMEIARKSTRMALVVKILGLMRGNRERRWVRSFKTDWIRTRTYYQVIIPDEQISSRQGTVACSRLPGCARRSVGTWKDSVPCG